MTNESEFDPKQRRLCPDGSCVGLIGPDGRCQVCGLPATGAPVPPDEPVADESPEAPGEVAAAPAGDAAGGFDPKRRLCDDGACVGVVDANGRCNVCGKVSGS